MILIKGSAIPKEEHRESLIAAARAIAIDTQSDDGCLLYEFSLSLDGRSIDSTELWGSREALEAHMQHKHTIDFLSSLGDVFDEPPIMTETLIN
ncbi:MAG: hypothetical protein RLZZ590_973 [Actinomycetota bacterium]|jgi:quinol monooxygenase YgiN